MEKTEKEQHAEQESDANQDQGHGSCMDDEDADQNYHFYKEYCRLYYANIILTNRL